MHRARDPLRRPACLGLACLGLLCVLAPTPARSEVHEIVGARYRLFYEGPREEAEEAGRVLEAAWAGFAAHFGKAPRMGRGDRLTVRFLQDRAGFEAAIRAVGTEPPASGAGGYYWPPARTAFLFRQPTRYFTRVLLLHEAAHQFHFLARTRNKGPRGPWYAEGVAEHLSWHDWDGRELRLGQVPLITIKDYPAAALHTVTQPGYRLSPFALGRAGGDRALCWALYGYLATGRGGKPVRGFERFRQRMDAGAACDGSFESAFGDPEDHLEPLIAWLRENQSPWKQVFNQWEGAGPGRVRGSARVVSFAHPKAEAEQISAVFAASPRGPWKAGLLLHYTSNDDYTVGLITSTLAIEVNRRRGGRWERLLARGAPPPDDEGDYGLAARREGEQVLFFVNGKEMGRFALPGRTLGLAVDGSTVYFERVRVR